MIIYTIYIYIYIYTKQLSISRRKCSIRGELIVKINDTTGYWWVKHMFRTRVLISDSSKLAAVVSLIFTIYIYIYNF